MVRSVKGSLHTHEHLHLNPQDPCKAEHGSYVSQSSCAEMGRGDRRFSARQQVTQTGVHSSRQHRDPALIEVKARTYLIFLNFLVCMPLHSQTHMQSNKQTCGHTYIYHRQMIDIGRRVGGWMDGLKRNYLKDSSQGMRITYILLSIMEFPIHFIIGLKGGLLPSLYTLNFCWLLRKIIHLGFASLYWSLYVQPSFWNHVFCDLCNRSVPSPQMPGREPLLASIL